MLGLTYILLLAAPAALAGAVDAIVGGGSLIIFPALLPAGCPSITANVTNNISMLPGYIGAARAYQSEL